MLKHIENHKKNQHLQSQMVNQNIFPQRVGHASMYCGGSSQALAVGKAEYIFNMSLHVLRPLLPFFGLSLVHKHVSFQRSMKYNPLARQ